MINWPDKLIEDIARRRCVIFVGSGVSQNSINEQGLRPLSWEQFLSQCTDKIALESDKKIIKRKIRERDYLTACEVVKSALRPEEFSDLVETTYLTPSFRAAKIHEHIFNLDLRLVVTPNFDKIYDTYANSVAEGTVKVKDFQSPDIASILRGKRSDRVIIKMHGSVDDANNLIFSRKDYVQARSKCRDFYTMLEALIMTHTFLFVGCGLDDPDIKLLLEDYAHKFSLGRDHYFVCRKKTHPLQIKSIAQSTMRIKFIEYSGSGSDHSKLTDSLEDLVGKVEAVRDSIAVGMDW